MAVTVVLKAIIQPVGTQDQPGFVPGRVIWAHGEREFNSLSELQAWAAEADSPANIGMATQLNICRAFRMDPTLTNLAALIDKSFIVDCTNVNPVRVTG